MDFLFWIYPFQAISSYFGLSCIGIFLDWIYTFHAISMNFGLNWQKNPQPRNQMEFFLEWIYPFQAIAATLGSAGRKAPFRGPNRQLFRLNLSISGNFQQFWVQLAVKLPQGAKQAKIVDWIYSFQAISSNFGFSWQLTPQQENMDFLFLIYPFQAISSNFAFSWQKGPFQYPNREFFVDWNYPFHPIPATLGSTGKKDFPSS